MAECKRKQCVLGLQMDGALATYIPKALGGESRLLYGARNHGASAPMVECDDSLIPEEIEENLFSFGPIVDHVGSCSSQT